MRALTIDELDSVNGAFSVQELGASMFAGGVAGGMLGMLAGGGGAGPGALAGALAGGLTYCAYEFILAR
jgi:hypothetical protein